MSTFREFEIRCDCFCHIGKNPTCDLTCCYLCVCGAHIKHDYVDEHKAGCPEHAHQTWMRKRREERRAAGTFIAGRRRKAG